MKFWIYYILAGLSLLHPHLTQKLEMFHKYTSDPNAMFWTVFNYQEFFDLLLHAILPLVLIAFGIRKQIKVSKLKKKTDSV